MMHLTYDNIPLSGPKNGKGETSGDVSAVNSTEGFADSGRLPEHLRSLVRDSLSANTRRAYASDLARYTAWGGSIPAGPKLIAEYLAAHQDTHAVASLLRWLVSLAKAHRAIDAPDPTRHELVRSVLRGIRRKHGSAQRQAKPLLRDDLFEVLDGIGSGTKADRDRALLLIGFAGGFRRSELVGLDVTDVDVEKQGLILNVRSSKTDQLGVGRKIGIPFGRTRHCPVHAMEAWLAVSEISTGPIFRPVNRHGEVLAKRLSGEAVSTIIKHRLRHASIDPAGYSGHSLRSGFATSAAQAGVSSWKIRQQTGHASDAMLVRYIRDGELFVENGAGAIL